jgi:hypothetical protein
MNLLQKLIYRIKERSITVRGNSRSAALNETNDMTVADLIAAEDIYVYNRDHKLPGLASPGFSSC